MSNKVNVSNASQVAQQKREEAGPKAEPKVEFGKVLQQKQADQAAPKPGAQAQAQARAGAGQMTAQQMNGQGVSMAAQQQAGLAQAGRPTISRPMVQNPHMAKIEQAAKQFDSQLAQAKQASVQQQANLGEARQATQAADMGRNEARAGDVAKNETRQEVHKQVQAERFADNKARVEAQQLANRAAQQARHANRAELMQGVGTTGETAKNAAVGGVKGARKPQEIPQEILDKLVEEVRVGVNAAGQDEFQIDLKDGVLQGMSLRVTAQNGKVNCHFVGGDNSAKNFIESSQGALARALESKGLSLADLKVSSA